MTKSSTTSQPTAMWPLIVSNIPRLSSALRSTTVLATERPRPKTMLPARLQPHIAATAVPSKVATAICTMAPGRAMTYGEEFVERKVQTDAEHQQHHADFSELVREVDIGDEARRGGTDDDAGDQITDQRRQF